MKPPTLKNDRIVHRLKMAAVALIVICFLGIVVSGVCERILVGAPSQPNVDSSQTVPLDVKGGGRFISTTTAEYCKNVSIWAMYGAAGGVIIISAIIYFGFGRLPHE